MSANVEVEVDGELTVARVTGIVDETFAGFGRLGQTKVLVIDVSGMSRMTSFGVRQWLKSKDALPASSETYLVGCPTFLVDQLNMVLNFGAGLRVLTVVAPYRCEGCGAEYAELVDLLANRALLAQGRAPDKDCARCGEKLEFDDAAESYFSFAKKYAPSNIDAATAQLLAARGIYTVPDTPASKSLQVIKLVHGSVTYFRIIGTINEMFRARAFLEGAEGEVVIDLEEVDAISARGLKEWRRLLDGLAGQVEAVTAVDVRESVFASAADSFAKIGVWSVLTPYKCSGCERISDQSVPASAPQAPPGVCSTCGGKTKPIAQRSISVKSRATPVESEQLIVKRHDLVSRARTDANVAHAADGLGTPASGDMILGKYKIIRPLSSGGMAEVFLAKQIGIGGFEKLVALKRIKRRRLDGRQHAIELFLNEAKIAGRLVHPNIVQVLDVGEVGGALYLAMEYVRGKDLRDVVRKLASRITMPLGEACYIVREIAQALHYAYSSTDLTGQRLSVVHRDVSPHNVILGFDGTVKLLDFGVAMSAITDQETSTIVGKWLYMPPEHALNEPIDHRSDLFSLGVVLYLLCCGSMPFFGKDPKEIVKKIRTGDYQPIAERAPDLPPQLSELVTRMLSVKPDERPQTGQEVVGELNEIMRRERIERSSADVASLLADLFPDDVDASLTPAERASQREISVSFTAPSTSVPTAERSTVDAPPPMRRVYVKPVLVAVLLALAAVIYFVLLK